MKNLQNFGVQELSLQEQKEVDGGGFFTFLAIMAVGALVFAIGNAIGNAFDNCE